MLTLFLRGILNNLIVTDRIYKWLHLLLGGLMILFGIIMIVESIIR